MVQDVKVGCKNPGMFNYMWYKNADNVWLHNGYRYCKKNFFSIFGKKALFISVHQYLTRY